MATRRERSPSIISISSEDNPIVSKKTGLPIPIIALDLSDEDAVPKEYATIIRIDLSHEAASLRSLKKPRLSAPKTEDTGTGLDLSPKKRRLDAPVAAKSNDYTTNASAPIGNATKANAQDSLGGSSDDAEAKLVALMRSWVDDGIESAIKEHSGTDAATTFRRYFCLWL
jgi:hypothetical protein